MNIHDVHDFDAKQAGKELLRVGFTVVDDISGELIDCAKDELHEELGHAADGIDIRIYEVATGWGPVFIFLDHDRADLAVARAFVFEHRSLP